MSTRLSPEREGCQSSTTVKPSSFSYSGFPFSASSRCVRRQVSDEKVWLETIGIGVSISSVSVGHRVFIVRAVRPAIYWHYHQDEPIRGWMNVGYVAHSYHVPPHVLYRALGLPHKPPDKRPLREIAKAQNRSMDEIRSRADWTRSFMRVHLILRHRRLLIREASP